MLDFARFALLTLTHKEFRQRVRNVRNIERRKHARGKKEGKTMTREEAFAKCTSDSYVEFYGGRWLVVPFAQVEQPRFFVCSPLATLGFDA